MKVNAQKSEILLSRKLRTDVPVRDVRGERIKQVEKFKCLDSVLSLTYFILLV